MVVTAQPILADGRRAGWHTPCSQFGTMPIASCGHCQTPIVDYSSVATVHDEVFCCRNCLVAARSQRAVAPPELPTCVRCVCAIVEPDSLVERHGQRFCCYNCAAAATHPARFAATAAA